MKSQFYFNQLKMFATCSATKESMAPITPDQNILRKTGISKKKKKRFYPKMKFFSKYRKILCLMKTILYHTQSHANSTFIRVKDTLIWPEKETKKKLREKSMECHNHKPQPFPDPNRKRKPTNPNKHKPNKHTKSTKISSLFPKRGNRNTKRTENIRTKRHTERHTTNRLAEQTTKQQRVRLTPGPPP